MRMLYGFLVLAICSVSAQGATDVKVDFTLHTADAYGAPMTESRYYYLYRPDNLSRNTPVPMVLVMEASPGSSAASFLHRKADQAGFLVVSCAIVGNSLGNVWNNDNPRITGWEDYDYTAAVISAVQLSDNANDAFICGLSKGGHMSYAYACEKPATIRAACSIDEFMGLTSNLPQAPVSIMAMHGTLDSNVPYTMGKDSVDAWRAVNGLLNATAVTTYEAALLQPGRVIQTTWRGGIGGTQVAFVTIIGGTHQYALPAVQTGYDCTDGMWAFFSQFLTGTQGAPRIVSQPVNNYQLSGLPAAFWVSATGTAPLSYQWQRNGIDIAGATTNWLTLPAASLADNGASFRAVVCNGSGCVTSPVAALTVAGIPANPAITAQPVNATVPAGQPVQFTVSATGSGGLAFQWRKNGMDITGATSSSLALPGAIMPDCGAAFNAVVTSGSSSVTNVVATLTVKPAPGAPIRITDPVRVRELLNQAGTFSVAAWSPTPMSYQWQKGVFTGNMVAVPGATSATYTPPPGTLSDNHALFRCTVSNAAGSVTSASEMLFVTSAATALTGFTSPITASGQVGGPFSYTITSSGGTAPVTFSADPLPGGLSLNPNTGVISGIPTAAGTTDVLLGANNSAGSVSTTLVLMLATTPPAIPVVSWRAAHFGASAFNPDIAGDQADPDGDGIRNLFEYAIGTDPLGAGKWPWSCAVQNGYFTLTVAKNPQATNVTWAAESSSDLTLWDKTGTTVLQNEGDTFRVRDNFPISAKSQRFFRVKLSVP